MPPRHGGDSPTRSPGDTLSADACHHSPDPRQPHPGPDPMGSRGRRAARRPARDRAHPGRFVAGSSARAKARRLGISDEKQDAEQRHIRAAKPKPRRQTVRLFGRDIPVLAAGDGALGAEDDGKAASAGSVRS